MFHGNTGTKLLVMLFYNELIPATLHEGLARFELGKPSQIRGTYVKYFAIICDFVGLLTSLQR